MPLDFAKERAFRIGAQTLSKNIRNLPGLSNLLSGNNPKNPVTSLQNYSSKRNTENLSFPLDVEGGPGVGNHGHYIMFYINAQDNAKLNMSSKTGEQSVIEGNKQNNIQDYITKFNTSKNAFEKFPNENGHSNQLNNNYTESVRKATGSKYGSYSGVGKVGKVDKIIRKNIKKEGSTISLKRAPTTRLKTAIAMYMPPQVSATYGANYTDTEIGAGVELGLSAFNDLLAGKYASAATNIGGLDDPIRDGLIKMVLGTLGALPGLGGISEADSIKRGRLISNRMELAFKGINKRQFQYTFKMIPRSKAEADEIRKIIYAFKFNMLPEFEGGNRAGRRFTVPNTFDIQYMYTGNQNQYLHNISTCVLETMNVTYGGDRFKTFEGNSTGAPVVETNMTLNFKEMELITRERVQEGY